MDTKLYPAFIDEIMKLLPVLRGSLILHSQDPISGVDLAGPESDMITIAESARMIGHPEILELSTQISPLLSSLRRGEGDARNTALLCLDLIAKLEASLLKISLDDENFSLDIDDFIDESFGLLQKNETLQPEAPILLDELPSGGPPVALSAPEIISDQFEIDQELLEIFAEEAEGLLKNIESSLGVLAGDPNDADALWEIRRNAHTFKGSAGIVGLDQLSKLAHRVEDLLDRIAEKENASRDGIFELLRSSTNCLTSLTTGDTSPAVLQTLADVHADFDRVLELIDENRPAEHLEARTEVQIPVPVAEPDFQAPVQIFTVADGSQASAEKVFEVINNDAAAVKSSQSRSIVRVSLGRLDELVRIVRDMIISRSAFEQRLRELDRQIDDLHNTTRRLQSTSSKLEIDFEASLLGSDGSSPFFPASSPPKTAPSGQYGFDELEFDRYTEFHQSTRELAETTSDTFAINTALDALRGNFEMLFDEQRRLVEELQERLMRIRMVEFGTLSNRLQRAVRVTCEEEDKKAQISLVNEKLEVDTQILDHLIEPLMHLLKNAVVHGIESPEIRRMVGKPEIGLIEVAVSNEETHIELSVSDDGRGISSTALREKAISMGLITGEKAKGMSEEEALELVFLPGLTTAKKLNLSAGRGVGMSIVKESVEAQNGIVSIRSVPQRGTAFRIRLPLKLAVTNVLLVKAGTLVYAIPQKQIQKISELTEADFDSNGAPLKVTLNGRKLAPVRLDNFVTSSAPQQVQNGMDLLHVDMAGQPLLLAVTEVQRTEEVVIKPLGGPLDNIKGVLGAAILGNGDLVTILDLPVLLRQKPKELEPPQVADAPRPISVMVVDDSPSVRHMTSKIISKAGWTVLTAKDGVDALEQLKASDGPPSLILSDIEMPRMDGYELAASLKRSEEFSNIPVVMITSRSAEKHRDKALETGVSKYLTKPYEEAELIETIKLLAGSI